MVFIFQMSLPFSAKRILRLNNRVFIFIQVIEAVKIERQVIRLLTILATKAIEACVLLLRLHPA